MGRQSNSIVYDERKMKKKTRAWWPLALGIATPAILIPLVAATWNHLGSVWAAPSDVKQLKATDEQLQQQIAQQQEQSTAIYKWIENEQKSKDVEAEQESAAPAGFRWNRATRKYDKI